jgi:mono/diheme cytochrome c family protein
VLALCLVLTSCAKSPEQEGEAEAGSEAGAVEVQDPIARGRMTYETSCMSCHGVSGKGDGEMASELKQQPADLTQISQEHGGSFPVDTVYQMIDGRREVEAHGSREMPVWGNIWTERDGEPIPEEEVQARINELVEYIRTLQVAEAS